MDDSRSVQHLRLLRSGAASPSRSGSSFSCSIILVRRSEAKSRLPSVLNRSPFCTYNKVVYDWDEAKREANLKKHGLDFADASLVYEHPEKITIRSDRKNEARAQDLAIVETAEGMLSLAYVLRDQSIRVISFRRASRRERRMYARIKSQQSN